MGQHFTNYGLEVGRQRNFTDFGLVQPGTDSVHAVGRRQGEHVVMAGAAEGPDQQVNGFVTAVAEENLLWQHPTPLGQARLDSTLVRVGIAVVGHGRDRSVGILIGIQKDAFGAGVVVAGRGVGHQFADVRAQQRREWVVGNSGCLHTCVPLANAWSRTLTARRCASRASAVAMRSTAGPRRRSPSGESS